jgi:hypothetical protein
MTRLPFLRLLLWYAALSFVMVGAKFLERPSSGGDGYSYISNILGLLLLQPWIHWLPSGHLGEGVNTPLWFLALSVLNLGLLVAVSVAVFWVRRKRGARA